MNFTKFQVYVLFLYPIWIFFTWFGYISIARNYVFLTVFAGLGRSISGWYTLIAVINESFIPTTQQCKALFIIILMTLTWDATNLLIYNQ